MIITNAISVSSWNQVCGKIGRFYLDSLDRWCGQAGWVYRRQGSRWFCKHVDVLTRLRPGYKRAQPGGGEAQRSIIIFIEIGILDENISWLQQGGNYWSTLNDCILTTWLIEPEKTRSKLGEAGKPCPGRHKTVNFFSPAVKSRMSRCWRWNNHIVVYSFAQLLLSRNGQKIVGFTIFYLFQTDFHDPIKVH